ncbi:MAG: hypothetical protein WCF93_01875 [Candidatus Moraniibacteriota bacterium]
MYNDIKHPYLTIKLKKMGIEKQSMGGESEKNFNPSRREFLN